MLYRLFITPALLQVWRGWWTEAAVVVAVMMLMVVALIETVIVVAVNRDSLGKS